MNPILNVVDAPTDHLENGEHFECYMAELAEPLGARSIGANVTRVPPGKAAFPFHHHRANEEHFFVLSGIGVLRFGAETYPVKPDDYVFTPAGGPELAHQFVNTGSDDLVYLAFATTVIPEVVGYPDSGKTGVRIASGRAKTSRFLVMDALESEVNYWDGEDGRAIAATIATPPRPDGCHRRS